MQAVLSNDALLHRVNDESNENAAAEFCVRWADMLIEALKEEK